MMIPVNSNAEFVLFTTEGCHLCDKAIQVISHALNLEVTSVELVDIAEEENSDQLIEVYGIRIPVIRHMKSNKEINWPFDASEFMAWLETL